jgi:hypothetical protein
MLDPDFMAPIIYLATDEAQNLTSQLIYASGGTLHMLDYCGHAYIRRWVMDRY